MAKLCHGCSKHFSRDPDMALSGIESMSSRGWDGANRIWSCNWLITMDKTAECPCQDCLIKSVCWDRCEKFITYQNSWQNVSRWG